MTADDQSVPNWRRCEIAWAAFLEAGGHLVTRLMDAVGNAEGSSAPLIEYQGKRFRAPDIESKIAGVSAYWEVKFRSRPEVNPLTGQSEYWMSHASAIDYREVHRLSGSQVWIVLHDSSAGAEGSRWFRASILDVLQSGRREQRSSSSGEVLEALIWPASCMDLIEGPPVDFDSTALPVLPDEGDRPAIPTSVLGPIERNLRRRIPLDPVQDESLPPGVYDMIRYDSQASLDVLRQQLGIPVFPRYSVLRIGSNGIDIEEVLALTRYGIRVFLITENRPILEMSDEDLTALFDARLVEWSIVPDIDGVEGWWVDGRGIGDLDSKVQGILESADQAGGVNLCQYLIVHADHSESVIVTAGAGTGKTETMSERLVFLMATSFLHPDPHESKHLFDLRLDDVALITFTRESAAEMRRRIARTLMIRQRLCDRCVLPAASWLMQLSSTDVDTIHSYAKKIIQRDGSVIGMTPSFRVSALTMDFRRILQEELSEHLGALYSEFPVEDVPAEFEFIKFLESLWRILSSNGLSPLRLTSSSGTRSADWGESPEGLDGAISEVCAKVIDAASERFRRTCLDVQAIPIGELVPTATAVLKQSGDSLRRRPRYVFVDEFQDTDAEQMDMILGLRMIAGSRLFVVGDEKQGIYRFRGAHGSAFSELRGRSEAFGMHPFKEYALVKNFRSGRRLLDSLHPWFSTWGTRDLLDYSEASRLESGLLDDGSAEVSISSVSNSPERQTRTVSSVQSWLKNDPKSSVAVLCRTNSQAREIQQVLRQAAIPCELRVGGNFFQTSAVREVRVLIEAVLDPTDDVALLELCETRWFSGLASMQAPVLLNDVHRESWGETLPKMLSWRARLASAQRTGSLERKDLDLLRNRVKGLGRLLELRPTLAWLVECSELMQPKRCRLIGEVDDVDLRAYGRCFDHLIAQLDNAFADAPISPHIVLEWLRLQIATNTSEDEPNPDPTSSASVTALTVHKSKGLEFDFVILPYTSAQFGPVKTMDEIAVVGRLDGSPQLLWKWKSRTGSKSFTNVSGADQSLWKMERSEIDREETRLLYVATTRARHRLEVLVQPKPKRAASRLSAWRDLISMVAVDGN